MERTFENSTKLVEESGEKNVNGHSNRKNSMCKGPAAMTRWEKHDTLGMPGTRGMGLKGQGGSLEASKAQSSRSW